MSDHPEPKSHDRSGVFNPHTGKRSFGLKEKSEFTDLQVQAKADREKRELRAHFSKKNPTGLCEIKGVDGSIIRKSGTPVMFG